jgi:hypothetical protein
VKATDEKVQRIVDEINFVNDSAHDEIRPILDAILNEVTADALRQVREAMHVRDQLRYLGAEQVVEEVAAEMGVTL